VEHPAGIEPATSRVKGEVTDVFTTAVSIFFLVMVREGGPPTTFLVISIES
jgi:hypothetical protein